MLVSLQIFSPLSTRSSLPHLPHILLFNAIQQLFLLRNSPHIPWAKISIYSDFPGGSDGKESGCNARDPGSIPGSERSPGEGHSNSFQYSCLENPMDRGAWQAIVHRVAQCQTQLSD